MIDHPTDISKDCHQTSQIFAQVAVVMNLTGQNGHYFCGSRSPCWRVRTDVPQPLYSTVPLFTSPYVSQSRCSPTLYSPLFPHEVRPMFPSPCVPQSLFSPVSMFPKDVPQSLCSPISLFPSPDVPLKCFQSLCSPKLFPSPYAPQSLCSAVPLFPQSILCSQTSFSPELFPVPIFPKYVPKSLCYT